MNITVSVWIYTHARVGKEEIIMDLGQRTVLTVVLKFKCLEPDQVKSNFIFSLRKKNIVADRLG